MGLGNTPSFSIEDDGFLRDVPLPAPPLPKPTLDPVIVLPPRLLPLPAPAPRRDTRPAFCVDDDSDATIEEGGTLQRAASLPAVLSSP